MTRSDNSLPPSGISLPLSLTRGSPVNGEYPWTSSFTDLSLPPYYNASATIDGVATPALIIAGTGSPPIPTPVPTFVPVIVAQSSTPVWQFPYVDSDGNAVSLSGKTVTFVAWQSLDGGQTKTVLFKHDNATIGGITITGGGNNLVNVAFTTGDTGTLLDSGGSYTLADSTDGLGIASGPYSIDPAVLN